MNNNFKIIEYLFLALFLIVMCSLLIDLLNYGAGLVFSFIAALGMIKRDDYKYINPERDPNTVKGWIVIQVLIKFADIIVAVAGAPIRLLWGKDLKEKYNHYHKN